MRTRIKICGVQDLSTANVVVTAGADAIGLMFYSDSKRYVNTDQAKKIVSQLPPMITKVGVFVNASHDEVQEVINHVQLDVLQFHGDEEDAFCNSFAMPYIKAIRVDAKIDLQETALQYQTASALLLDTYDDSGYGGTGKTFDWEMVKCVKDKCIVLAGGLTIDNVQRAIRTASPYAVDISSGVETNRQKDPKKIEEFCSKVHQSMFN